MNILGSHRQTEGKCNPHILSLFTWEREFINMTNGYWSILAKDLCWRNVLKVFIQRDAVKVFIQRNALKVFFSFSRIKWIITPKCRVSSSWQLSYLCLVIWISFMIIGLTTMITKTFFQDHLQSLREDTWNFLGLRGPLWTTLEPFHPLPKSIWYPKGPPLGAHGSPQVSGRSRDLHFV